MRIIFFVLFNLFFLGLSAQDSVYIHLVRPSKVQVLSRPDTRSKYLGEFKEDDTVKVLGDAVKGWYKVEHPNGQGFLQEISLRTLRYSQAEYTRKVKAQNLQAYLRAALQYDRWQFWLIFAGGLALCLGLHRLWLWAYDRMEDEESPFSQDLSSHAIFAIWGMVLGLCYKFSPIAFLESLVVEGFSWGFPAAGFWASLAWLLVYILSLWLVFKFFRGLLRFRLWALAEATARLVLRFSWLVWGLIALVGLWYPILFVFGLYWLYLALTTPSNDGEWITVYIRRR